MKRNISCITLGIALFFWLSGTVVNTWAEVKFVPMVDASAAVNTGKWEGEFAKEVDANDESTSHNLYLYVAPNVGFSEIPGLWITPLLEYEYNGANNILNIEDEAFFYDQRQDFYFLLGANYAFSRVWSAKLKGFGRIEKTRATSEDTLDTGLYNFNDFGGWGEISAAYRLGSLPLRTKLGYKGYARRYPNYLPLTKDVDQLSNTVLASSLEAALPPDAELKSSNVGELWLRNELTWGRAPLLTNLEFRIKDVMYTEMPAILSDGTYGDEKRHDAYFDFSLEVPFLINPYHQIEFDYAYRLRGSNQAFYDTGEPEPLYLAGYYNYYQNSFRILWNFKFWFKITDFTPRGSIGFSWQNRQYLNRPSRQKQFDNDTAGAYVFDQPHWENNLDFAINLRQQLFAKWFHLFVSLHSITQDSNTNVEDFSTYIYKYTTFTLGTAVSF